MFFNTINSSSQIGLSHVTSSTLLVKSGHYKHLPLQSTTDKGSHSGVTQDMKSSDTIECDPLSVVDWSGKCL